MALTDLANQVAALKTSIETALGVALDKDEAIAAAAYAKALETLVKPDGVVTLIKEADTQIARVTAEGDTQNARILGLLGETYLSVDTTIPTDNFGTYIADAAITVTIPDDRLKEWRVTFLTTSSGSITFVSGNNTITGLGAGNTGVMNPRGLVQLRAVADNTLEVF